MTASTHPALCVLLAEDEIMISMMLGDHLEQAGYRVLLAANLGAALEMARHEPIDVAVLDVNLDGEQSFPVAEALRDRGIGFIFASGYGAEGIPEEYRGERILQKPYDTKTLLGSLERVHRESVPDDESD